VSHTLEKDQFVASAAHKHPRLIELRALPRKSVVTRLATTWLLIAPSGPNQPLKCPHAVPHRSECVWKRDKRALTPAPLTASRRS
jgi:hypothetical protein